MYECRCWFLLFILSQRRKKERKKNQKIWMWKQEESLYSLWKEKKGEKMWKCNRRRRKTLINAKYLKKNYVIYFNNAYVESKSLWKIYIIIIRRSKRKDYRHWVWEGIQGVQKGNYVRKRQCRKTNLVK